MARSTAECDEWVWLDVDPPALGGKPQSSMHEPVDSNLMETISEPEPQSIHDPVSEMSERIQFAGEWNCDAGYQPGDLVMMNGNYYVCCSHCVGIDPTSNHVRENDPWAEAATGQFAHIFLGSSSAADLQATWLVGDGTPARSPTASSSSSSSPEKTASCIRLDQTIFPNIRHRLIGLLDCMERMLENAD